MDADDLKVFEAVARLGTISRAAAELHTVQSNVTTRVRLLEDGLRTPLFRRHARGVELTAAGRRLLPYAARVKALLEEARRAVEGTTGRPAGRLHVGSLETTAGVRLTSVLAAYTAAYPEVDLALHTATTGELTKDVLAHRLEGAFVCGPMHHAELEGEVFFHEELAIVTPPAVRTLEELPTRRDLKIVVLRNGYSYRQRLEDLLAQRGAVGLRQLESGSIEGIIACVTAGSGVTLLPKSVVETHRRNGSVAVHELPATEARVETVFIRRRDTFVSSALAAFLECTRVVAARGDQTAA